MNRAEKEKEVAFIRDALTGAEAIVLSSLKGLTVTEVNQLRDSLHEAGVTMRVVKNTLAKKAIEGTDMTVLNDDFKNETAIAWSNDDAVAPAKTLMKFKKDVEKINIKSGYSQGQRLDESEVEALSKLPSLDELRSKLLGLFQAVPAKLVRQINAPAQQVAGVVQARVAKEKDAA
jgi:large subunit ribosomal protein L10